MYEANRYSDQPLPDSSYPDPTAAEAIAKASKKKYLPLVYICSKYSGDVVTNTEAAKARLIS